MITESGEEDFYKKKVKEKEKRENNFSRFKSGLVLNDSTVLFWGDSRLLPILDINTGKLKRILRGHTDFINGVLKLQDGRVLSWSDDTTLKI